MFLNTFSWTGMFIITLEPKCIREYKIVQESEWYVCGRCWATSSLLSKSDKNPVFCLDRSVSPRKRWVLNIVSTSSGKVTNKRKTTTLTVNKYVCE